MNRFEARTRPSAAPADQQPPPVVAQQPLESEPEPEGRPEIHEMEQELTQRLVHDLAQRIIGGSNETIGDFMQSFRELNPDEDSGGLQNELFCFIFYRLSFAELVDLVNHENASSMDRIVPELQQFLRERFFNGEAPTEAGIKEASLRIITDHNDAWPEILVKFFFNVEKSMVLCFLFLIYFIFFFEL